MKRVIVVASMAAVLVGAAGCSNSSQGQPVPSTAGITASTPTSQDPGTSSNSTGVISDIADANACSLLTPSDAAKLALPSAGSTDNLNAKSGCAWDNDSYSIGVYIRTDAGLSDVQLNGGTLTDIRVGSHQAKQLVETTGGCLVALGINSATRVDVQAEGNGQNVCPEAQAVAQLVEKHLPA